MKPTLSRGLVILGALVVVFPGYASAQSERWANASVWGKPMSNPVYNDLAMVKREVNLAYIYQRLSGHVDSVLGDIPIGGDLHAVAVQFELPIGDSNVSVVANKSGYADFNPEEGPLSKESGLVDLAGGLKWTFLSCETYAIAARATVEIPIGDEDVFQGNGDGNISPALLATYLDDKNCLNGVAGAIIPFDNDSESTMGYVSVSYARKITEWFAPHIELNWFRVLDSGDAEASFDNQLGTVVPSIITFEGGDLFNFGARESEDEQDFVSLAVGARFQLGENLSLGAVYEIPLTAEDQGLMNKRITAHLTLTF